jgi:hypothetical protein
MPAVSVPLYESHLTACGQIRSALTAMKAPIDSSDTRTNLIALNAIQQQLLELPYPTNLVGRVETLSQSIQALEKTLADIEDGIRGALLYPVQ